MLDILILNPWLLAALWLARVYQTTLSRYVVYEQGVELNPNFEREIARRQTIAPKFILLLALSVVITLLFPRLVMLLLNGSWLEYLFEEFLAGALLLTWTFINSRHLRNYALVWFLRRRPDGLKGRQEYSYWFMQRLLASEALTFGLLYFFLMLLTWRIFFLAGALACLALALRAYRLANRKFPDPAVVTADIK